MSNERPIHPQADEQDQFVTILNGMWDRITDLRCAAAAIGPASERLADENLACGQSLVARTLVDLERLVDELEKWRLRERAT